MPGCAHCRDLQDTTQKELRHAVKLLYSAAGIQHLSMARTPAPPAPGVPGARGQTAVPGFLTAAAVRLELRNDTTPHLGALKELVYVYREGALAASAACLPPCLLLPVARRSSAAQAALPAGALTSHLLLLASHLHVSTVSRLRAGDGVPVNPAIAHRLLLLLAELGHPEAQADIAFHLALGIEPVAPNPRDQLFRCAAATPSPTVPLACGGQQGCTALLDLPQRESLACGRCSAACGTCGYAPAGCSPARSCLPSARPAQAGRARPGRRPGALCLCRPGGGPGGPDVPGIPPPARHRRAAQLPDRWGAWGTVPGPCGGLVPGLPSTLAPMQRAYCCEGRGSRPTGEPRQLGAPILAGRRQRPPRGMLPCHRPYALGTLLPGLRLTLSRAFPVPLSVPLPVQLRCTTPQLPKR